MPGEGQGLARCGISPARLSSGIEKHGGGLGPGLALNPAGRVLVDGDVTLTESDAILPYLGETAGRLWPATAAGRAEALQFAVGKPGSHTPATSPRRLGGRRGQRRAEPERSGPPGRRAPRGALRLALPRRYCTDASDAPYAGAGKWPAAASHRRRSMMLSQAIVSATRRGNGLYAAALSQ
jgi:glutathione S-transferase